MNLSDEFVRELLDGGEVESYIAILLHRAGLPVCMERRVIAGPTHTRKDFLEQMDVWCYSDGLEIKGRRIAFTCPEDFPFTEVWIGDADRWDEREGQPLALVYVSLVTGAVMVLPVARTRHMWARVTGTDGRMDRPDLNATYAVPPVCFITWDEFVERMKARWHS